MTQNDRHDALIILRYVSCGKFFLKKNLPGRFAAQLVSHHQRFQTSLLGLACHESPFPRHPPPLLWGARMPPPPPRKPNFPMPNPFLHTLRQAHTSFPSSLGNSEPREYSATHTVNKDGTERMGCQVGDGEMDS